MKRYIRIVLIAICLGTAIYFIGKQTVERKADERREREQAVLVENYIKQEYNIDCSVIRTDFQHYDEGITGGLFMYVFTCKDDKGNVFEVTYRSYFDLMETSVAELKLEGYFF